jgi:hypothetical protein
MSDTQTQLAIDAAGAFANPYWYSQAETAVQKLIHRGAYFTTDDVWELLKDCGYTTPEPRALGAVIRQFAKDKYIIPTGSYRKSVRPECHRRPLAVWRPYKLDTGDAE